MKIDNNEIYGAIFDLDGTILDSLNVWYEIDTRFFRMHNMEVPAMYHKEIAHLSLEKIAMLTKEKYGFKESALEICNIWRTMAQSIYKTNVKLKPYVIDLLNYLKDNNILLAVATANEDYLYIPCLKELGVYEYFSLFNDLNKLKCVKKDEYFFKETAKAMKLNAENIVVFEDTFEAIVAAKNAFFTTIAIKENTHLENEKKIIANHYVNDFKEAMALFK